MAVEPGGAPGAPSALFVTSEIFPFSKTGGLGDASAALVSALRAAGADVRSISPGYSGALGKAAGARSVMRLAPFAGFAAGGILAVEDETGATHYVVRSADAFERPGGLYQAPGRRDWPDNHRRFARLCRAALDLARVGDGHWRPAVLHGNDWHAGLLPAWTRGADLASVLTIHNAVFQGLFPIEDAAAVDVAPDVAARIGLYGHLSMLKAGVVFADRVAAVSPHFAEEVLSPAFGVGLEAALRARPDGVAGILNPIDARRWSPATDDLLPTRFDADDLAGKAVCKQAAQRAFGLVEDPAAPLVAIVSRVTHQKMSDVVAAAAPDLLALAPDLQIALCGEGEPAMETALACAGEAHPRFRPILEYSEALAHLAIAGADILLHPSRFEPCGLTPIYARRYGAVPVATRVGGHVDSIRDRKSVDEGDGFLFDGERPADLVAALARVLARRSDPEGWRALVRRGMTAPDGSAEAARRYLDLYRSALASKQGQSARP